MSDEMKMGSADRERLGTKLSGQAPGKVEHEGAVPNINGLHNNVKESIGNDSTTSFRESHIFGEPGIQR